MLRPSYNQLIKKVNENFDTKEPIVRSRYSIVLAAAKRARQLVDGNESYVDNDIRKPLSVAVAELDSGKVQILPDADQRQQQETGIEETGAEDLAKPDEAAEELAEDKPNAAEETGDAGQAFAAEPTEEILL